LHGPATVDTFAANDHGLPLIRTDKPQHFGVMPTLLPLVRVHEAHVFGEHCRRDRARIHGGPHAIEAKIHFGLGAVLSRLNVWDPQPTRP